MSKIIPVLILAGIMSGCCALSGFFAGCGIDVHRDSKITLVYLGARDCHYCSTWEEDELPKFLASEEIKHLEFLKIVRNTFHRALLPDDLPDDYRWLYGSIVKDGGTPTFVVLVDKSVVRDVAGSNNWDTKIMPLLTNLVAKKSAARD